MSNSSQNTGVPRVLHYGTEGQYNTLIMEMLGPSLEDLFTYCNRQFTVKTVCMIAEQLITRVEYIHNKHFIHRDIKPDNFLIGSTHSLIATSQSNSNSQGNNNIVSQNNSRLIYAIDFGLAKKYRDSRNNIHIPYTEDRELIGTVRYASLNAHLGREQSRRDDLESLGYMLMYFLRGSLPWQGLKANGKKEKYKKIQNKKMSTTPEMLCQGYDNEFIDYLKYCRNLVFDQQPNYDYLRKLFRNVMKKYNYQYDWNFDWVEKQNTTNNHTQNISNSIQQQHNNNQNNIQNIYNGGLQAIPQQQHYNTQTNITNGYNTNNIQNTNHQHTTQQQQTTAQPYQQYLYTQPQQNVLKPDYQPIVQQTPYYTTM